MQRMEVFDEVSVEIQEHRSTAENSSRQIRGWANSLQNSEIQSQRHLSDDSRDRYERMNRREEFNKQQAEYKRELEERLKRKVQERKD
ncbi:hypothetical protein K239x_05070 [Planctomycetes bacterium K23_9]|uniref:Uncharacterized protein n=1 Tax=Stieleria marina TaxID=1930275 RepID=A0A517NN62_9BACT|nr:hypothetical protein K239x_05070 [Planctomycetes bacterium K23_9]